MDTLVAVIKLIEGKVGVLPFEKKDEWFIKTEIAKLMDVIL